MSQTQRRQRRRTGARSQRRVALGKHLIRRMEKGDPKALDFVAESEILFRTPIPDPDIPEAKLRAFATLPDPISRLDEIVEAECETADVVQLRQEAKGVSDIAEAEQRRLRRQRRELDEEQARNKAREWMPPPGASKRHKSKAIRAAERLRYRLWIALAIGCSLAELLNSFVNTPGDGDSYWLIEAGPRLAFSVWSVLAPFGLLKFVHRQLSDKAAARMNKILGSIGLGMLVGCLTLFSYKLAELHAPVTMSGADRWQPPYELLFFGMQALLALTVYAALLMSEEQWAKSHDLQWSTTVKAQNRSERSNRIDSCLASTDFILGVVTPVPLELQRRQARARTAFEARLISLVNDRKEATEVRKRQQEEVDLKKRQIAQQDRANADRSSIKGKLDQIADALAKTQADMDALDRKPPSRDAT